MRKQLKALLVEHDLVLELWYDSSTKEFACAYTTGNDTHLTNCYGRTLDALLKKLLQEMK